MRRVVFCFLLLVVSAGCESTGRTVGISTSEESSSKNVIPPMVEDEVVQEPIFVEPEEDSLPSGPAIQPQELEQALAENQTEVQPKTVLQASPPEQKKIVVPAPAQPQIAASAKPIQSKTLQDIHFAFDEATIVPLAKPTLEANADLLRTRYKNRDLLVEGHCDQRGSVEYNLVLGARRAQAVKTYLVGLGIYQSRVRIVSYGKERSVCSQANERCWQRNRRVHFVLQ